MTLEKYTRQPIPTPITEEGSTTATPIPQLVLLPERNANGNKRTKNYRHKIRLINEYGCVCTRCYAVKEVEDLTLDHILPKFLCPKAIYNTKQNWQLLCMKCHKLKSTIEHSFMARIIQKTIESVHCNNTDIIRLKEVIQEFRELISRWITKNAEV